jgi:hypothetical protein
MQLTHTGSDTTNTVFLDGISTSVPGYGTSFRAMTASSFEALTGTGGAPITIVEILTAPMTITQTIAGTGNQVIINGAGGFSGATYRIVTATNVALPLPQWAPIVTNQFSTNGGFSYTNVIQPNPGAQFFRAVP